jgi:hypothetical protein
MPDSEYQQSYPKWIYAKKDGVIVSRIVNDPAERDKLGAGWAESPDGPFVQQAAPKPPAKQSVPKPRPRRRK